MLVLTRQVGESLMIDDSVTLTVMSVDGSQVKIGVDAPKEIDVHREEIYLRIQREKSLAAKSDTVASLDVRSSFLLQPNTQTKPEVDIQIKKKDFLFYLSLLRKNHINEN